jgi:type IV pilus assembly protein PilE
MKKSHNGFTLVEMVIVILILGVLAAISIPSYREYVIRGHRRAAQAAMMEIATRQQQYFVANRTYATKAQLGYVLPDQVGDFYDYDIDLDAGPPPGFEITFDSQGSQASDGDLTLNSEGVKGPADKWKK